MWDKLSDPISQFSLLLVVLVKLTFQTIKFLIFSVKTKALLLHVNVVPLEEHPANVFDFHYVKTVALNQYNIPMQSTQQTNKQMQCLSYDWAYPCSQTSLFSFQSKKNTFLVLATSPMTKKVALDQKKSSVKLNALNDKPHCLSVCSQGQTHYLVEGIAWIF